MRVLLHALGTDRARKGFSSLFDVEKKTVHLLGEIAPDNCPPSGKNDHDELYRRIFQADKGKKYPSPFGE